MSKTTTKALSLDAVVTALRAKGFTVRHYGNPAERLAYEVFNADGYAIRDEAGLRQVLSGTDSYFGSLF